MTEFIRHLQARSMLNKAAKHVFVIVRQLLFRLAKRPPCPFELAIGFFCYLSCQTFALVLTYAIQTATIPLRNMEAIHHDLHALAKHLFGCMHNPCRHICTYGVDRLTYALRYTTEKCFDWGFPPVRHPPHNDRLCRHTSCDAGPTITVPFFQRYLVETNHLEPGHVFPRDFSLHRTLNDTHDRFLTAIFFDTGILTRTIDQAQQNLFFICLVKALRAVDQESVWVVVA